MSKEGAKIFFKKIFFRPKILEKPLFFAIFGQKFGKSSEPAELNRLLKRVKFEIYLLYMPHNCDFDNKFQNLSVLATPLGSSRKKRNINCGLQGRGGYTALQADVPNRKNFQSVRLFSEESIKSA